MEEAEAALCLADETRYFNVSRVLMFVSFPDHLNAIVAYQRGSVHAVLPVIIRSLLQAPHAVIVRFGLMLCPLQARQRLQDLTLCLKGEELCLAYARVRPLCCQVLHNVSCFARVCA